MASITIDDSEFRKAAAALSASSFRSLENRVVPPILRGAGNVVRKNVRAELAPHRRSGKTASHVTVRKAGSGLGTVVTVQAGGKTAHLLEGGTRAHDEVAHGRAMTIRGAGASNSAVTGSSKRIRGAGAVSGFAGVVHHPATAAVPFFDRGVEKSGPEVQTLIDAGADQIVAALIAKMR